MTGASSTSRVSFISSMPSVPGSIFELVRAVDEEMDGIARDQPQRPESIEELISRRGRSAALGETS
ncbi:MAG: hypothetical protein OXG27_04570 [Chloroflexi bacterium]|nr:hypothetical protein [Chloroflexota bacterium]